MKKTVKLLALLASITTLAACGNTTSSTSSAEEEVSSSEEVSSVASSSLDDADDNSFYTSKYFEDTLGIFLNGLLDYNFTITFDNYKEVTLMGEDAIYTKYIGEASTQYTDYGVVDSKTAGYWYYTVDESNNFQLGDIIVAGNPSTKHLRNVDSVYAAIYAFINSYETWEGHTESSYYTLNDDTFTAMVEMLDLDTTKFAGRSATLSFLSDNTARVDYTLYEIDDGDYSYYGEGNFLISKKSALKVNGLDKYLEDPKSYIVNPTEFTEEEKALMAKYAGEAIPFVDGISCGHTFSEDSTNGYFVMDDILCGDISEDVCAALEAAGWTLDTDNSGDSGSGYYIYAYYKGPYMVKFAWIPATALSDNKATQKYYPYGMLEIMGYNDGTLRTLDEINANLNGLVTTSDGKQALPAFDFGTYTSANLKWVDETSTYAAYGYTFVYAFTGEFDTVDDSIAALNGFADILVEAGYTNVLDEDNGYTDPKLSTDCTGVLYSLADDSWNYMGYEIDLTSEYVYDDDGNVLYDDDGYPVTQLTNAFSIMIYSY